MTTFAQAEVHAGAWKLAANEVWNIPDVPEVRFDMETVGPWQILSKLRALDIDLDGRVFGMRSTVDDLRKGRELLDIVVAAFTAASIDTQVEEMQS